MRDVTALVATICRDPYALACVESLRKQYPDMQIMVGDQNLRTDDRWDAFYKAGADKIIDLPHDCGVPYSRNEMMEFVETDYILIGDDDFYYTETANVPAMRTIAEQFDFVGGQLYQNGRVVEYQGWIDRVGSSFVYRKLPMTDFETYKGYRYKPCNLVFNYFVANVRFADKVLWDENITVSYEHSDFFIMAKQKGLTTAFTPDSTVVHKPEHVQLSSDDMKEYLYYRLRRQDKNYFYSKWAVDSVTGFSGQEDRIENPFWPLSQEAPDVQAGRL